MSTFRNLALRYRSISWLLVAAILSVVLLPAHLHFHHDHEHEHGLDTTGAARAHDVHLHLMGDSTDANHHDEAHVLSITTEALAKKLTYDHTPLLLALLLLSVLPLLTRCGGLSNEPPHGRDARPYHGLNPPLRAPPQA